MTDSAQTQELIRAAEQAGLPTQLAAVRTLAAAIDRNFYSDCRITTTQWWQLQLKG